ncbi:hypothetical protein L9F63_019012, partial [Diploptera punctata]
SSFLCLIKIFSNYLGNVELNVKTSRILLEFLILNTSNSLREYVTNPCVQFNIGRIITLNIILFNIYKINMIYLSFTLQ